MRARSRFLIVFLLGASCAGGDDESGAFPCGVNGGSCDADEVCVVGGPDQCSTCVPMPAACDEETACSCLPPGTDAHWGSYACVDAGECSEVGGGLVLTCAEIEWGCG